MVSLPDGEKISKISLFVLAQLRNVTDGQTTDRHRVTEIAALCIASHGKKTKQELWSLLYLYLYLIVVVGRRELRAPDSLSNLFLNVLTVYSAWTTSSNNLFQWLVTLWLKKFWRNSRRLLVVSSLYNCVPWCCGSLWFVVWRSRSGQPFLFRSRYCRFRSSLLVAFFDV